MSKIMKFLFITLILLSSSQSRAREVLDRAIEAFGGKAFLDVREIESRGRFFEFVKGELSGGGAFADYIKLPDKERTEFGKDRKSALINNGDQGWVIEDKEVKPQPPDAVEAFQREFKASFDYLFRYVLNDPKTTIQYIGTQILDFDRVDVLEIRDTNKNRITLYFDRQTSLLVKKQVRIPDKPEVKEEQYSNYHKIQGVTTPLFLSRFTDGVKTMEIRSESVFYNSGLAETLFTATPSK